MTVLEEELLKTIGKSLETVDDYERAVLGLDPSVDGMAKMTAVVLLASAIKGPGADQIAKWSGYKRFLVREISRNMRGRGAWKAGNVLDPSAFWKEVQAVRYGGPLTEPRKPRKRKTTPYTIKELLALHSDINHYRQDSPGGYSVGHQKRRLTLEEWQRVESSIEERQLVVVMRTSSFGFNLGIDLVKPPPYPSLPITPIMAIAQKSIPEVLAYKDGFKQGDKEWNPLNEWNATWELFSKWAFTERNLDMVKFCGINMPLNKGAYQY